MNKQLITLMVVLMTTLAVPATAQIAVGAKGGVNFNSFRQSQAFRNYFDAIPGFNAGAYAKYPVFNFLNARIEVLYFQQGANIYDYRVLPEMYRSGAKVKFHNVEVPLLAELGLPSLNEDVLQPKLLIGGFYSYTIYARESYTNIVKLSGYDRVDYKGHLDVQSQYNQHQYGLVAGLGAEMKVFNKPVSIEFRYQYNMNRQNKAGTQYDYNLAATTAKWGNELKLHTLSINIGVTLVYL